MSILSFSCRALPRGLRAARPYLSTFHPGCPSRSLATEASTQGGGGGGGGREGKREGTIADAFASLSGQEFKPLEPRFAALKSELLRGNEAALLASWRRLLGALREETARVAALGSSVVPHIDFADTTAAGSDDASLQRADFAAEFKKRGVAVVRGVLPEHEALALKDGLRAYIADNPHTKAFPADNPAVYELYWSPAQVAARADPRMLAAQRFVLSHWHSGGDAEAAVSTGTPVAYADRLRMRRPGDSQFALGPHVDGGSCERWERGGYGLGGVYDAVFAGRWEDLDQWEASCRLPVVSDLYNGIGACSALRMCQGWLSISHAAPFEGTLLANPMLKLATAYYLLRPFFTPRLPPPMPPSGDDKGAAAPGTGTTVDTGYTEEFLAADNWVLEGSSSIGGIGGDRGEVSSWLQGATPGHGQELRAGLHPHLELERTMVHVPAVAPGDYVVWHCDTIHSVDAVHRGAADSSVLYIPACPLTEANARYLLRQRDAFLAGRPSPDMPGGDGESAHVGRPGPRDVEAAGGDAGLQAMGLARWDPEREGLTPGERKVMAKANEILGFA